MNGRRNFEAKNEKPILDNCNQYNKKFQIEMNNIPKLNFNKIKLLKPKIDASNGGNPNLLKINFNFLHDTNLNKKNKNIVPEFLTKNSIIQNENIKCQDILKHPKIKHLKKLKELDKTSKALEVNQCEIKIKNDLENMRLIREPERDVLDMDSTNVSNINGYIAINKNTTKNYEATLRKSKNNNIVHELGYNSNHLNTSINMQKQNNFRNSSCDLNPEKNSINELNPGANYKTLTPGPKNKTNFYDDSKIKSRNHFSNILSIKRNKSSLNKNTNLLLDTSSNLNYNLLLLADKLRNNNNRSNSHKKEEKVEILKNMVEGLTKLTTIMLEDSNSESGSESISTGNKILLKNKKTIGVNQKNNSLLISSTTGKIIIQEKHRQILNNSINKNTIDYDQTINVTEQPLSNCKNLKRFLHKNSKIEINDVNANKSFDLNRKINQNSANTNNSFIMQIENEDRQILALSKSKSNSKIKYIIENRYSNSSLKDVVKTELSRNFKIKLNSTVNNFNTLISDKSIEINERFKNIQKRRLKDLTTIDYNKKDDFIMINKSYLNNYTSTCAENSKFKIDKFEFKISKNPHQNPMRIFDQKRDYSCGLNCDIERISAKKDDCKRVKKNETIDINDTLPNYEFID